jgi:Tol biopolymer transport system component
MWSPDGKHIAFNFIGNDHIWRVGVIDIDGKNFDVLSDASQKNVWTFLGGWTGSERVFSCMMIRRFMKWIYKKIS